MSPTTISLLGISTSCAVAEDGRLSAARGRRARAGRRSCRAGDFISIQCPKSTNVTSIAAASKNVSSSPTKRSGRRWKVGRQHAGRDQHAHVQRAAPQRVVGAADEDPAGPEDDRRREHQHDPVVVDAGVGRSIPRKFVPERRVEDRRDREQPARRRSGCACRAPSPPPSSGRTCRGPCRRARPLPCVPRSWAACAPVAGSSYCIRSCLVPIVIGAICAWWCMWVVSCCAVGAAASAASVPLISSPDRPPHRASRRDSEPHRFACEIDLSVDDVGIGLERASSSSAQQAQYRFETGSLTFVMDEPEFGSRFG